jgi:hypothetical protein
MLAPHRQPPRSQMANLRKRGREARDCVYARATVEDHITSGVKSLIIENPRSLLSCYPTEFRAMMQLLLAAGSSVLLLEINPLKVLCPFPSRSGRSPMGGKRLFILAQRNATAAFLREVHRRFTQEVEQATPPPPTPRMKYPNPIHCP